jgi:hypothetical protein
LWGEDGRVTGVHPIAKLKKVDGQKGKDLKSIIITELLNVIAL